MDWSQLMAQLAKSYCAAAVKIARACDDCDLARPPTVFRQKLTHGKLSENAFFGVSHATRGKS